MFFFGVGFFVFDIFFSKKILVFFFAFVSFQFKKFPVFFFFAGTKKSKNKNKETTFFQKSKKGKIPKIKKNQKMKKRKMSKIKLIKQKSVENTRGHSFMDSKASTHCVLARWLAFARLSPKTMFFFLRPSGWQD